MAPAPAVLLILAATTSLSMSPPPATASGAALQRLQAEHPLVIAHRGYSKAAPENTLPAFRLGVETGSDLVELDYHHSADGVPVVMHDFTLDRTTDAVVRLGRTGVAVRDLPAASIQELDAGAWYGAPFSGTRVPLLTEALDVIQAGSVTLIERKAGDAATCAQLLQARGLVNHVVVQSFDWAYLRELHALLPAQVLGALGPTGRPDGRPLSEAERQLSPAHLDAIVAAGARVAVWSRDVSAPAIAAAHARGLRVWVYTIDDPAAAAALVALGVDGIITNEPKLMAVALKSPNPASPHAANP